MRAIREMDNMPRMRSLIGRPLTLTGGTWNLVGPAPLLANFPTADSPAGGTNYFGGSVWALAVDPRTKDTVYLGGAGGGVWKTLDGGANWQSMTDTQPWLPIGAIALDPSNPNTVYAGTGGPFGIYGDGILKSVDAGSTWSYIPGPFSSLAGSGSFFGGAEVIALAVSPSNSSVLLAAIGGLGAPHGGIFRSTDGGNTWTQVLPGGQGSAVFFYPSSGSIAYAAVSNDFGSASDGVYKSSDGGATWTPSNGSGTSQLPGAIVGQILLSPAPSSPTTMYAAVSQSNPSTSLFFKTLDGGATWFQPSTLLDLPADPPQTMTVHPSNPSVILIGSHDYINRSTDGGSTWARAMPPRFNDNRFFTFSADGSRFYLGDDAGVYSSDDSLAHLTNLNRTLPLVLFYPGLSIHPTNPAISFGGAQDLGINRYNGSPTWDWVFNCDGGSTAIDFNTPSTIYATCHSTAPQVIIKSTASGDINSWNAAQSGLNFTTDRPRFIPPLIMDPSNSQRLYFGATHLYQSNDGAVSWQSISPALTTDPSGFSSISAMAVAPINSNYVYVGTADGHVSMTANALQGVSSSWSNVITGLPVRAVTSVQVHPATPTTAYVTFSGFSGFGNTGHVFKTSDAGAHWQDVSSNLPNIPLNDIVIDPDVSGTLYVASDMGVFISTNDGTNWAVLGAGLPRVIVHSLRLHRPSRTLRAATFGRSMWDISVAIGGAPALTVTKTHTGTFSQGGTGIYTVTVSNLSASATNGLVTLTENLPAGLTILSMTGTGWTCPPAANSCTRTDVLNVGAAYPDITVMVNVASNAFPQVTNQVSVSGGGSVAASAVDPTTILTQQGTPVGLRFVPVTPCRIADTRNAAGPFGGPALGAGVSRDFVVPSSACGIPASAAAYSLNVTVVPTGPLGYISVWPAGQSQPVVSTLNSLDGRIKANAAIVPAGLNGAFTVYATNPTDLTVDINGYFVVASGSQNLAFYPVAPCRVTDTRNPVGAFGAPTLAGGVPRTFPVPSSICGIPAGAQAYALNMTVVPAGPLGFLSTWPAGSSQPLVSTLNALTGTVTSNAAIVPAGSNGAITVYATNPTDLIIDINGYFAPQGTGSLDFYTATPCRVLDTRNAVGPFGGPIMGAAQSRSFPVPSSGCGIPASAKAYSLNATVVPSSLLGYLTLWGSGVQPLVSTLNSIDGTIVANAALAG